MKFLLHSTVVLGLSLALAAPAGAEFQAREIKVTNGLNAEHPIGTGVAAMNACLAKRSGGKIKATPYWSHALGSEQQAAQALYAGLQEMMIEPPSPLVGVEPALGVFDLPFLFANEAEADAVLDGEFGKYIAAKMAPHGLVVLGFWENGFRHVTNSRGPVEKPENLKGLRIRVMQNSIFLDTFKTLEANAIPMAWGELFAALETKTVDAQENPIAIIQAAKFYEVQKYLSLTGHVYSPLMVSYSKRLWDQLSGDEKTVIQACVIKGQAAERSDMRARNAKTLEQLKAEGMQINALDKTQAARLREMVNVVYDRHAKQIGEETISMVRKVLAGIRK